MSGAARWVTVERCVVCHLRSNALVKAVRGAASQHMDQKERERVVTAMYQWVLDMGLEVRGVEGSVVDGGSFEWPLVRLELKRFQRVSDREGHQWTEYQEPEDLASMADQATLFEERLEKLLDTAADVVAQIEAGVPIQVALRNTWNVRKGRAA